MESFRATLKGELIQERAFASRAAAKSETFWDPEVCCHRTRLHGAPGFYSPVDSEHQSELNIPPPAPQRVRFIGERSIWVYYGQPGRR